VSRQADLRDEPDGRAVGDQVREVVLVVGRDEHHAPVELREALDEAGGEHEAALAAESDVGQDDVRVQRFRLAQRVRLVRRRADDIHSAVHEMVLGNREESLVVVHDETPPAAGDQISPMLSAHRGTHRRPPSPCPSAPPPGTS
jgi:hypothetical protein